MNYKSLYSFFSDIFKVKFNFKKIKKIPIVIYDEYSAIIGDFFKPEKYYVLDVRIKSINLRILAKSLIIYKFKWKPKFYLITFLSELNPSYIITFIDNDVRFWNLKKYLKNTETAFIQNGWRDSFLDVFSTLSQEDHNSFEVDRMFVFSSVIGTKYKKYITGDSYPIGSYRNNSFEIDKKVSNDGIIFISSYTPDWKTLSSNKNLADYEGQEKILFYLLCKISREKKIKLSVLGKQPSPFNQMEEKFYKEIDKDFIFIPKTKEKYKNYRHIDDSKLVVSVDSTLGYESLARGKRTAFFSIRSQDSDNKSYNFGWPNKFQDLGPFWINYYDEFYIRKIIDYLLNISDKEWNTETRKYINKIMIYDSGNEILKKYIKEIEFKTN